MRFKLLTFLTFGCFALIPLKSPLIYGKLSNEEILETVNDINMSDELYFENFKINNTNFSSDGLLSRFKVNSKQIDEDAKYGIEFEVTNESNETYNKLNIPGLYNEFKGVDLKTGSININLDLGLHVLKGLLNFKISFYKNDLNLYSFTFKIHSLTNRSIKMSTTDFKIYYEVLLNSKKIIERYEKLSFLGVDDLLTYDLYRSVPLDEIKIKYTFNKGEEFNGKVYYYVCDFNNYLKSYLPLNFNSEFNFNGLELKTINDDSLIELEVKNDIFLNEKTYEMSLYRTESFNQKVKTIYFPKKYFSTFSNTYHCLKIDNLGKSKASIHYIFRIKMNKLFIENCFEIIGDHKKVIDDNFFDTVIL